MKTVDILYGSYYDYEYQYIKIGGVQTYITTLTKTILDLGWKVRIFQLDVRSFKVNLQKNVEIIGIDSRDFKKKYDQMVKYVLDSREDGDEYITFFATDNILPTFFVKNSIAVQHGVFWDIPSEKEVPFWRGIISKLLGAVKILKRLKNVQKLVCVDYNFINWYRTQTPNHKIQLFAVPNFSRIPDSVEKPKGTIKIIFARRLFYYRGTKLFVEAAEKLLENYSNIEITVAGEGPDEEFMRKRLEKHPNVKITKYASEESLDIHLSQHIAVVPTLGSEGTSLSLLEAMASGCAVVCTDVGGMTNIVLNEYNGLMVRADAEELYLAISRLIEDEQLRSRLSVKARESVQQAFSFEKWENEWKKILLNF